MKRGRPSSGQLCNDIQDAIPSGTRKNTVTSRTAGATNSSPASCWRRRRVRRLAADLCRDGVAAVTEVIFPEGWKGKAPAVEPIPFELTFGVICQPLDRAWRSGCRARARCARPGMTAFLRFGRLLPRLVDD